MIKVALYARVSTKDQDTDNQTNRMKEYAEMRGYEVFDEYFEKVSGSKDAKRPEQERLLTDAKRRRFEKVIVIKIDRLGRSIKNLVEILENLETSGVGLEVIDQPIDTSTAMGKFITIILGAAAEFELELIRERTRDGLERTVKNGTKLGRKVKTLSAYQIEKIKAILQENPNISNRQLADQFEGITRNTLIRLARAEGLIQ